MKNKPLKIGFLTMFFLIAIAFLLFYFKMKVSSIIAIILFGLIGGTFIVLFNGYFNPGIWMHKNRFLLYGFLYGIALFVFTNLNHLSEGETTINAKNWGFLLLISICLGILLGGIFLSWNYRVIKNQTKLQLHPDENIILEDTASIDNEDAMGSGRLIMTNNRLVFIFLNIEIEHFEVYFTNISYSTVLCNKFGIPNGISLAEKDSEILVKFPKLWENEIQKMINKYAL